MTRDPETGEMKDGRMEARRKGLVRKVAAIVGLFRKRARIG